MSAIVLASASPRRHEILLAAGIAHIVRTAAIPEIRRRDEPPMDFVKRLAEEKARAVPSGEDEIVLGADTVVVVDDRVFGKPAGESDAQRMLQALSGRGHWVYTGMCLLSQQRCIVDSAATKVIFSALTEEEISEYVRSGEPMDKAGAYAIQGLASKFIRGIEGCYQNVVGLPVSLVYRHLQSFA